MVPNLTELPGCHLPTLRRHSVLLAKQREKIRAFMLLKPGNLKPQQLVPSGSPAIVYIPVVAVHDDLREALDALAIERKSVYKAFPSTVRPGS